MIGCEHHIVAFFGTMTFPYLGNTLMVLEKKNETQKYTTIHLKQRVACELSNMLSRRQLQVSLC